MSMIGVLVFVGCLQVLFRDRSDWRELVLMLLFKKWLLS